MFGSMSRYRDSMLSVSCCSAVWAAAWSALHVVTWSRVCPRVWPQCPVYHVVCQCSPRMCLYLIFL